MSADMHPQRSEAGRLYGYITMDINVIYKEDCLTGLGRIPDGIVDLVFTDPPYYQNRAGDEAARLRGEESMCASDIIDNIRL